MLLNIKVARAAGNVKRYHTHELLKEEKVGQHTFNMLNILMIVTDRNLSRNLMMAALVHDMGEYETGDIPSPVKRASPELKPILDDIEDRAMRAAHVGFYPQLTPWEHKLLKFADNLDGLLKIIDELKLGNKTVRWVGERYLSYLRTMEDLGPTMNSLVDEAEEEFKNER